MTDSEPERSPSDPQASEPPPPEAPLPNVAGSSAAPSRPSRLVALERLALRFFGAPATGEAAGLFRIAYGVLAIWESIAVWMNLDRYFSAGALIPYDLVKNDPYVWMSVFSYAPDSSLVLYGHAVVFTVAAVLLAIGFYPRAMALVVCYVNISLQLRNPFILNSGDRLFQITAGLAALMPLGRRFSVDAWRRARAERAPARLGSVYGQRLLQLNICYVYLSSCIAKLMNERWRQGIALRDVLSSPVFSEWPHYYDFFPVVATLTWMTLLFEGLFPLLVWQKRLRPWMLLWGLAFHVGIDTLMVIPVFSAIMIVSYGAFLSDAEAAWLVARLRRPFSKRLPSARPTPAPT